MLLNGLARLMNFRKEFVTKLNANCPAGSLTIEFLFLEEVLKQNMKFSPEGGIRSLIHALGNLS
jgi:hypothetical protein